MFVCFFHSAGCGTECVCVDIRKAALNLILDWVKIYSQNRPLAKPTDAKTQTPTQIPTQIKISRITDPPPNEPAAPETSVPKSSEESSDRKTVDDAGPSAAQGSDSVHVRINPDNLKNYVGPPIYQKDRIYTHAPPAGVSTGLGYLGNGSGAVMPVEAMVCSFLSSSMVMFMQVLM